MSDHDEQILLQGFREEADLYGQALQVLDGLPAAFRQGQDGQPSLQQVIGLLGSVATVESRIATTKQQWQQSGRKPGPALKAELDRVAELIQELAARIGVAEREAHAQKDGLAPELDALVRSRQMQRAYGGMRG